MNAEMFVRWPDLAREHGLNRETVAKHFKQRGCRCGLPKLTDDDIIRQQLDALERRIAKSEEHNKHN